MRRLMLLGAVFWASTALAELPGKEADGWFSWQLASASQPTIYVRLNSGALTELRTHEHNCYAIPKGPVTDLGLVSADESFRWFQRFVENSDIDDDSRQTALFGVVQSDTDEAFEFIGSLLLD